MKQWRFVPGRAKKGAAGLLFLGFVGMGIASASQLNVNSGAVAAGVHDVSSCDTDGVQVSFDIAWDAVAGTHAITDVDILGVAVGCVGETLDLTFIDGVGSVSYTNSVVISGGTVSFTGVNVAASDATDVAIAIS